MSRASALARGQVAAQAGMRDACTIRRITGEATDDFSGVMTPTYATIYTGKCRVQQAVAIARPHEVGEDHVLIVRFDLQLPVAGTSGLKVNDQVTITAAVNDPDLINRVFLILELAHKSEPTARRVGMIERTS
jgi:Family of unknown function (DUF6093)